MKIASWNLKGGFSDPNREGQIALGIKKVDADIMFCPEGYDPTVNFSEILIKILEKKFQISTYDYEDEDPNAGRTNNEPGNHGFVVLTKLATADSVSLELIRPGDHRNALLATIKNANNQPILRIAGIHLDDRSEEDRELTIVELVNKNKPDLIIGDFNALDTKTKQAKLFGSTAMQFGARLLPPSMFRNLALRLNEMANSEVITYLEHAGYVDVDPAETPTIRPTTSRITPRLVRLDRAMGEPKTTELSDYRVYKNISGSDHVPISVEVESIR